MKRSQLQIFEDMKVKVKHFINIGIHFETKTCRFSSVYLQLPLLLRPPDGPVEVDLLEDGLVVLVHQVDGQVEDYHLELVMM